MIDTDNDVALDGRPAWEGVDADTGHKLDYLAGESTDGADAEWHTFTACVRSVATEHAGRVNPNDLRPLLKAAEINPHRVGAFYRRALMCGLLDDSPELYATSSDVKSRNRGKPVRVYTFHPERGTE